MHHDFVLCVENCPKTTKSWGIWGCQSKLYLPKRKTEAPIIKDQQTSVTFKAREMTSFEQNNLSLFPFAAAFHQPVLQVGANSPNTHSNWHSNSLIPTGSGTQTHSPQLALALKPTHSFQLALTLKPTHSNSPSTHFNRRSTHPNNPSPLLQRASY